MLDQSIRKEVGARGEEREKTNNGSGHENTNFKDGGL